MEMISEKLFGMIWVLMKRVEENKTIGKEEFQEYYGYKERM